jgi:hypothetical protein
MGETLPDDWLQFSIMDAMRGVRLPTLKRSLAEEERRELARAIFTKFKQARFEVVTHPRPLHSAGGTRGIPPTWKTSTSGAPPTSS